MASEAEPPLLETQGSSVSLAEQILEKTLVLQKQGTEVDNRMPAPVHYPADHNVPDSANISPVTSPHPNESHLRVLPNGAPVPAGNARSTSPTDGRSLLSTSPTASICSLDSAFSMFTSSTMSSLAKYSVGAAHSPAFPGLSIRRSMASDRSNVRDMLVGTGVFQPAEVSAALDVFDAFQRQPLDGHQLLSFTATLALPTTHNEPRVAAWLAFSESDAGVFDLRCIAVDVAAQHCGLGSSLMDYAEKAICQQGGHLSVVSTPSRSSPKSRSFYQRLGYTMEASLRAYYQSGDDRLVFVKHLHKNSVPAHSKTVDVRLQIPSTPETWKREHQETTEIEDADEDPALPQSLRGEAVLKHPTATHAAPSAVPAAHAAATPVEAMPAPAAPAPASASTGTPVPCNSPTSTLRAAFESDESDDSGHLTDDSEPEPLPAHPHGSVASTHAHHHHHVATTTPPLSPPAPAARSLVARSRRAPCFAQVPDEMWDDYRWQMAHKLTKAQDFEQAGIVLSASERAAFASPSHLPVSVTPYLASLMDPVNSKCPIRMQFLPTEAELHIDASDLEDSLDEDAMSPVPGLVHRYPDRCLMLVSMICSNYCRFCTRNRIVGSAAGAEACGNVATASGEIVAMSDSQKESLAASRYAKQLEYIRGHPEIRDVLLSGGDVLLLPNRTIEFLLSQLRAIPHVQIIRLGSRVPIVCPQRVQPELTAILAKYHPVWLNVHCNHPKELSPEAVRALGLLADAGIPLGNQSVLMAGINDCPNIMLELVHRLVAARVRPYYLYQCDEVKGAAHFRTPISKGLEIMEALRGHTSGFCNPLYIVDCPHGGGKVPLMPNYLVSQSDRRVVLRNFEGFMVSYDNPRNYHEHNESDCKFCRDHLAHPTTRRPASQDPCQSSDVSELLMGRGNYIAPAGWKEHHCGKQH
ncbi:putative L-lysine 2; 3-aminomutase [Paratrimastix pyriformis]|uniref:L-lysine 2 n=1 Tax=Paratrimastix pyriformis TaxID=342808 RepID=A0ABQ8UIW4_9EUKA|nr:putative L-lysine 2; 3-aminomutase [Paratrimastix pyriformis]|eukprot:GAFH01000788.1.p1 GENE.GAFH01000788.1~~GAFH01000788.1.p1  ORF type:complete len:921 (-),score=229.13 GAFH01000788.1:240-3002(-)